MKSTIKTFALGIAIFMMAACASQKNQVSHNQRLGGQRGGPPSYSQLLSEMDANKDGKLAKNEVKGPLQRDFSTIDRNKDGFIVKSELENAPMSQRGQHLP